MAVESHPVPPFRLDLTVWALRRRARNRIDVWDGRYRRVLVVQGRPVLAQLTQPGTAGTEPVIIEVSAPGRDLTDSRVRRVQRVIEGSLGMAVDLGSFYSMASRDEHLGDLARRFRGLKPPRFPSLFETLANAVACQQLSLEVGIELLGRMADTFGGRLGELRGFPEPATIAAAPVASLRALGFSTRKAETLIGVATRIAEGALDEASLDGLSRSDAVATLMSLDGIGRWSAEYVLLRGLGHLDVYPGDDVGARNKLRALLDLPRPPDYAEVNRVTARWAPQAGMVYFHLLLAGLTQSGVIGAAV